MEPALARACQDFEAIVLRPMFAALKPAALPASADEHADDGAGDATSMVESLFADALAMAFARAGGLGIARELSHALEPAER